MEESKEKKPHFSSNPNVSSLTSNDILSRHEIKTSRQPPNKPPEDGVGQKKEKTYHSADDIHKSVVTSQEEIIGRTLEKLNMAPADRPMTQKSHTQIIQKVHGSLSKLIDDFTSPNDFNYVREGMIMDKIILLSQARLDAKGATFDSEEKLDRVSTEITKDIDDLIAITKKSRDSFANDTFTKFIATPNIQEKLPQKKSLFRKLFPKMFPDEEEAVIQNLENVDLMHADIDWTPIIPDPQKYIGKSYSLGVIKRLRKLRKIYNELKDPSTGIKYSNGKSANTRYIKSWFSGDQLISWMQKYFEKNNLNGVLNDTLEDALTLCRLLFHLGFIVSVERSSIFIGEDKPYIFQAPFFLPNEIGSPSHWDYARYLLRRSYFPTSKHRLLPWEITNLEMLQHLLGKDWEQIEKQVDLDLSFLSKQAKIPSRIYKLQEFRFWSVYRSAPDTCEHFLDEDAQFLKKQRLTNEDYEKTLITNANSLLKWYEKRVDGLKDLVSLKLTKVSTEVSSMIEHCTVTSLLDGFLYDPCPSNPWISNDESIWDPNRQITVNEIKYWKSGLNFLLMDKRGVDLFWEFCKKEFSEENLRFVSACKEVQKSTTMQIFDRKAKQIYLEYINQGAVAEINIGSNIKKELHSVFLPLLQQKQSLLPEQTDVFGRAVDHILKLMEKDSYKRFCEKELISNN